MVPPPATSAPRFRGDILAAGVLTGIIIVALSYLTIPLTYDEAFYLLLSRRIAEGGFPTRLVGPDLSSMEVFLNSPPLLFYLMAPAQWLAPASQILPAGSCFSS